MPKRLDLSFQFGVSIHAGFDAMFMWNATNEIRQKTRDPKKEHRATAKSHRHGCFLWVVLGLALSSAVTFCLITSSLLKINFYASFIALFILLISIESTWGRQQKKERHRKVRRPFGLMPQIAPKKH